MRPVSARAVELLKAACHHEGLPFDEVAGGLVSAPAQAVEWEPFARALRRLGARLGHEDALVWLGATMVESESAAQLRALAVAFASPNLLYRALAQWLVPAAVGVLRGTCEELDERHLRVVLELEPDAVESREIFQVCLGASRTVPRLLGLPDATVEARIEARRAELVIETPSPGAALARLLRARTAAASTLALVEAIEAQARALRARDADLARVLAAVRRTLDRLQEGALLLRSGQIAHVNERLAALLGSAPGSLLGRALLELVAEPHRERVARALSPAPTDGSADASAPVEIELLGAEGLVVAELLPPELLDAEEGLSLLLLREPPQPRSVERHTPVVPVLPVDRVEPPTTARRRTVLVADDDALIRAAVRRTLLRAGYDVREAADGVEALELVRAPLRARPGEPALEPFDLLLTDIRMPRLDGFSLAEALQEIAPDLPVLFMSGFSDVLYEPSEIPRGRLLPKPFTPATLLSVVRDLLGVEGAGVAARGGAPTS